jgi:integrase
MSELNEARIRAAKPKEKPYKLRDGRGLHLLVTPRGTRLWRLRFRHVGRESMVSLGAYPDVSLKVARERREDARKLVASGVDPASQRRAERAGLENTFEGIALEWLEKQQFAPATLEKAKWTFRELIFPRLGSRPIATVTAPEVLAVLQRIEVHGKHETAHRTKQRISQVMRYAIATGRAEHDVTADLRGALTRVKTEHFAALIEPQRVGELLRAIDAYTGQPSTAHALRLAPYVFVRPGELRFAEWREFDLEGAEWRIPAEKMKMDEYHLVPLSRQAVSIIRELRPFTGNGKYLFPSLRTRDRPISDATLNAALRRLGYSGDEQTTHGFRTIADTFLNELGFPPDVIELQLAHKERNKVRAAYNRAQRLDERRKMMQVWSDHLDGLKAGNHAARGDQSATALITR